MKDRYKYRAKRLDNNEWYYGSYLYLHNADKFDWNGTRHSTNEDVHYIIDENDVNYAVSSDTLCQCTGLKDKNGTLIYEGDIVKFKNCNDILVINHQKEMACFAPQFYCNGEYGGRLWFDDYDSFECQFYKSNNFEVIDNIYDNPELLAESE